MKTISNKNNKYNIQGDTDRAGSGIGQSLDRVVVSILCIGLFFS